MTLSDKAYSAMRRDIVSGTLAPEQPLRMAALSKRYEMGFSPLREALNRLQADRLVVSTPLKGFNVAAISVSEMADTLSTRILIETEALRLSIKNGDDHWETLIVSSLHALNLVARRAETGKAFDPWQMEDRHHDFHRALISACGSSWLLDFFERLYAESERYRFPLLSLPPHHATRNVSAEHSALSEAALARDSRTAIKLLTEHYKKTQENIKALMEPELFKPVSGTH